MTYKNILVDVEGGRADIRLNRPAKYNALSPEMCEEIACAAEELAARPDIKCIVFSGEGRNFSAGFDVASEQSATDTKSVWLANRRIQNAFSRINELPVVTVCALKGYVVGAGLLLAAVCNLRYATPDTVFFVPELDMGIPFSLGGVATIARYIGITRTTEMVLTCNKVTASSPYMENFVTRVFDEERLTPSVDQIVADIVKRPNSLLLSSLTTIREAEKGLLPKPASDLFTMLFVDVETEAKTVRVNYSKRFKS
ncbi:MAG: enoyl-CoA hydratase/isomerase family protein [Burkholderiaceae bacterium]|nr:enoyl-CoA hydratase/isomerase family protein [Burkholderiaceae bacterium]